MTNLLKTRDQIEREFTRKAFVAHYEYLKDYLRLIGKPENIVVLAVDESVPVSYTFSPDQVTNVQALEKGLSFTHIINGERKEVFIGWMSVGTMYSPELGQQVAPPLGDPFAQAHIAFMNKKSNAITSTEKASEHFDPFEERPEVMEKRSKIKLC